MPEPLTDEQLAYFQQWTDRLADGPCNGCRIASKSMASLLAEVARLRTRETGLVADYKPGCPSCGSSSIKRCDSELTLCEDCDLLFRAKETT